MTALDRYSRLEAIGQWSHAGEPPREVVIKFGDARLTLTTLDEEPLTQWSIAAVQERPMGESGEVILSPDPDFSETVVVSDRDFLKALRSILAEDVAGPPALPLRRRWQVWAGVGVGLALGVYLLGSPLYAPWLAPAVTSEAWSRLSDDVLRQLTTGPAGALPQTAICAAPRSTAMRTLADRLGPAVGPVSVVTTLPETAHALRLPDGHIVVPSHLLNTRYGPEVLAAHLLAATLGPSDALRADALAATGRDALMIAISGQFEAEHAAAVAQVVLAPAPVAPEDLARALTDLGLPTYPYVDYLFSEGRDREAAALAAAPSIGFANYTPTLSDGLWLTLQARCLP